MPIRRLLRGGVFISLLWCITLSNAAQDPIIVFAASSLTNALSDIADAYTAETGTPVILNFAGSSTLAAQIEQGAPADVFASANDVQMQRLVTAELVHPDEVRVFAENDLILIVPADNPAAIQSAQDLAQSGVLLVFAAPSVPIRDYTDILLNTLTIYYGDDYESLVVQNVVSEEPNVRQIVARIALGEADAAFVYRSDVTPDIADAVQVIPLPEGASPRAVYPIAAISESRQGDSAHDFVAFVESASGQVILSQWGFCPPSARLDDDTATPIIERTPDVTVAIDETDDDLERTHENAPTTACQ